MAEKVRGWGQNIWFHISLRFLMFESWNTFRPAQPGVMVVVLTLMIFVFHMMAARFQTAACTLTRNTIYPTTTSIPPVRFPFCNAAAKSQYVNFTPDCSRFWECGPPPAFEACLLVCPPCSPGMGCPYACQDSDGQLYQANFFDER